MSTVPRTHTTDEVQGLMKVSLVVTIVFSDSRWSVPRRARSWPRCRPRC